MPSLMLNWAIHPIAEAVAGTNSGDVKTSRRGKHQRFTPPSEPAGSEPHPHNGVLHLEGPVTTEPASRITMGRGQPTHEEIAAAAYLIYLQEGCPEGREVQHWLEAEEQLKAVPLLTIEAEVTVKSETETRTREGTLHVSASA
jgi:hypothetical protein